MNYQVIQNSWLTGSELLDLGFLCMVLYPGKTQDMISCQKKLVDFIKEHYPTFLGAHTCLDCFQNTDHCVHPCCINKAKDFARRVDLQVVEKTVKKYIGIE